MLAALPDGTADDLLPSAFVQRSADRTGLGLGLAMCRWGAELNDGHISRAQPACSRVRVYGQRFRAVLSESTRAGAN